MALSSFTLLLNIADETRKGRLVAFDSGGRLSSSQLTLRHEAPLIALRCVRPSTSGVRPWDDVDLEALRASAGVRLGLGEFDKAPDSGTFDLTYDGDDDDLTGLAYGITAAALLAALNANTAITAAGGIATVTQVGRSYRITFATVGDKDDFAVAANDLAPLCYIRLAKLVAGDGDTKEVWSLTIKRQPYAYCDTWTAAAAASVTVATAIAGDATHSEVQTITLTPGAYGGTYSFSMTLPNVVTGDGSGTTTAAIVLAATDSADQVLAKLQEHPEAINADSTSNLTVTGNVGGPFSIGFIGELANLNIATSTGANIDLLVPQTITGTLDLNTDPMLSFLEAAGANEASLIVELELQEPGGEPFKPFQDSWTIRKDLIDLATTRPATDPAYPNPGLIMQFRRDITALTGGASNALDSIVTATGVVQAVLIASGAGVPKLWGLVSGTDAEDSANGIVRPDDYDGSTNAYVWKSLL